MSRPIKFRAWDFREQRMVYKSLYDRNWYYTPKNDEAGCHTAYECDARKESRHSDPMQFTGLHDKNGKEIYEGDILLVDGESRHLVKYMIDADYPAFDLQPFLSDDCSSLQYAYFELEPKIIGNIFENPELLEKNND